MYFRVDPHIYPNEDGSNLFMITLDSDTVITLVPPSNEQHRRTNVIDIANESFTNKDIDILHKQGDLLCLSNNARHKYEWSIRQGIDGNVDELVNIRKKQLNLYDESLEDQQMNDIIKNTDKYIPANHDALNKRDNDWILCDWWGNNNQIIPRCNDRIGIYILFSRPT